nr:MULTISPECIES: response regulator transcription factor [unclassified Fusibacter]
MEMAGFEVTLAPNGKVGLTIALAEKFDLYILDVMLPEIDGITIAKKIRESKDTPIIMVTAKSKESDTIRGFSIGIDDYVTKPFSPAELVARTKAHIQRYETLKRISKEDDHDRIEIRGLLINLDHRQVFMNGETIELTPKEYDLLTLLASAPNKVFAKEEIFQKVWGLDSDHDIPTITVHIRKIREKLEFDASNPEYIHTVWGVGYKMVK